MTYKTAWLLKQKLQRPMQREPLKGPVEVGHSQIPFRGADTLFDPTKSGMVKVAAAISSLEIRLAAIPDDFAASIEAFVRANVKRGATLLANSYPRFAGYHHVPQQADKARRLPTTFDLLRGYRRRRRDPLHKYLRKFVVYHNDRHREVSLDAVLRIALDHEPASYRNITGRDKRRTDVP